MNLEDFTGMVRVSAFNSLSDKMDEVFKVFYYLLFDIWKLTLFFL